LGAGVFLKKFLTPLFPHTSSFLVFPAFIIPIQKGSEKIAIL